MSRLAIIGTGYVGLTTGACLAHLGHDVICADIDEVKVERLQRGEIPIVEAGLEQLVAEGLRSGKLRFVVGAEAAAARCEIAFLCVPTPQGGDDRADLSFIETAARQLAAVLPTESIVVNKSTVPVGSTKVVERVLQRGDVSVVSNPEFLREGSAVHDFLHPDRIVIGADDRAAAIRVASLYLGVAAPLIVTDPASAETIKYAANAFLATKISFINAVAAVCEAVGADVQDVILGIGYDKRIGQEFLRPGPGWGGSCFVGDETALVRQDGGPLRLLTFAALDAEVERAGANGWEVLSWDADAVRPLMRPVTVFTRRPYDGELVSLRTKMGRRLTVTADHPMVVRRDGVEQTIAAGELTADDWLPIAFEHPMPDPGPTTLDSRPSSWHAIGLALSEGHLTANDRDELRLGTDSYTKRIPDLVWGLPLESQEALLRGLWDGDGSWSLVSGGPSVVLEYVTVSRELADGMVRLLAMHGVMARLKVGRTAKGTRDTYWLTISGADNIEQALFLVPEHEESEIRRHLDAQYKRIRPTGYRVLDKGTAWVRVVETRRHHAVCDVYSLEVSGTHTVVTSFGLVAHNCFPKDTRAMVRIAEDHGYDFDLLKGVIEVNEHQLVRMVDKIEHAAGGSLVGVTVAAWGLTFKARTDDLRESPALAIIDRLVARGATVRAFDPTVRRDLPGMAVVGDAYEACQGAAVLAVLTEWDEFRWLDLDQVAARMSGRAVVDTRNLLDRAALQRLGFTYQGVGR